MLRIPVVLILGLLISATVAGRAEDWPQFRGPGGQGQAVGAGWPLRWSEQENIAWKVPIPGRGWSSPVVSGQQIWLTTALETAATVEVTKRTLERKGKDVPSPQVASHLTLKAICVDRASGRVLHDVTLFEIDEPEVISSSNSFASPTPVVDRGRVFCEFGALGTACVDAATGTVIWSRRLVVDHQVGPGSSPVVYGNLLILVRDGIDQQYVTALDQASGQTVWRTDRPPLAPRCRPLRKAFSTPLVFQARRPRPDGGYRRALDRVVRAGDGPGIVAGRYGRHVLECLASGLRVRPGLRRHFLRRLRTAGHPPRRTGGRHRHARRLAASEIGSQAVLAAAGGRRIVPGRGQWRRLLSGRAQRSLPLEPAAVRGPSWPRRLPRTGGSISSAKRARRPWCVPASNSSSWLKITWTAASWLRPRWLTRRSSFAPRRIYTRSSRQPSSRVSRPTAQNPSFPSRHWR